MKQRFGRASDRDNRRSMRLPSSRAVVGALLVTGAAMSVLLAHHRTGSVPDTRWIVLSHDVVAGHTITVEDLGSVAIDLPDGVVAVDADDADAVLGRVAARNLAELELLGPSDLLDRQRFASPSEVEVMVELSPTAALAGTVRAGDIVSVLSTDPAGAGTTTVLSGARVTGTDAVEDGIGSTGGTPIRLSVADAAAAEALIDASVRTELTLALPNPVGGDR